MKIYKIGFVIVFSLSTLLLAGCGIFSRQSNVPVRLVSHSQKITAANIASKRLSACEQAPVLLANLAKPAEQRRYALKPGVLCR